jgi:hypothetical protein
MGSMDVDEDTIVTPPRDLTNIPVGIDTDTIIRYRTATFEPEAVMLPTFVETGPLVAGELPDTPEKLVEPPVRPTRLSPEEVAAAASAAMASAAVDSVAVEGVVVDSVAIESAAVEASAPSSPGALGDTVPVDYSFRINDGAPVPLDMPTLIGRRPALPRIMRGSAPKLVSVASPRREVSASHLELRQQGALVIVTDLRSTNGSIVRMPGRSPLTLGQGESLVVAPGTVVDIGDGNLIEVLPLQRVESNGAARARGDDGGRQQ